MIIINNNVNSRFMKNLAIQNMFTYFYMVYSIDCLVINNNYNNNYSNNNTRIIINVIIIRTLHKTNPTWNTAAYTGGNLVTCAYPATLSVLIFTCTSEKGYIILFFC